MSPRSFNHSTVLLDEAVEALDPQPDGLYVDCTVGGAGHSLAILDRLGPGGRLIALDRDPSAVLVARSRIEDRLAAREDAPTAEVVHAAFSDLARVLEDRSIVRGAVHGILADLGVSSPQLDVAERGFSFRLDGPLDMRMDTSTGPTAADLVNTLDEREIADILYTHGDERASRRVARAIVARRAERPFERTEDLAAVIALNIPRKDKKPGINPATKSFQALRIAVNGEHQELATLLADGIGWLARQGRLAIITFHSGEDRAAKRMLASLAKGERLPPAEAIYRTHGEPTVRLPHPKGLTPSADEIARNPRARSARLRVAEKIA